MQIESTFTLITAFQFLFLSLFLFFYKKGLRSPNILFALFLLGKGIILSFNIILEDYRPEVGSLISIINVFYFPTLYFYTPFLFLYIKATTTINFHFRLKHLVHLIPSVLLLSTAILMQLGFVPIQKEYFITINALYYVQAITYTILALRDISRFKKVSKSKIAIKWLHVLMTGFMIIMLTFLTSFILHVLKIPLPNISGLLNTIGLLMLFIFANGFVFNTLYNPILFSDVKNLSGIKKNLPIPKEVNPETAEALISLMEKKMLFLNPNLTSNEVAEELNIHPRSLSLLLRHSFKKNFFDFVNGYRITNAKNILKNDSDNKTFYEILLDSGFNNKSVFNAAFKKHCGMTPSSYKKSLQVKTMHK